MELTVLASSLTAAFESQGSKLTLRMRHDNGSVQSIHTAVKEWQPIRFIERVANKGMKAAVGA